MPARGRGRRQLAAAAAAAAASVGADTNAADDLEEREDQEEQDEDAVPADEVVDDDDGYDNESLSSKDEVEEEKETKIKIEPNEDDPAQSEAGGDPASPSETRQQQDRDQDPPAHSTRSSVSKKRPADSQPSTAPPVSVESATGRGGRGRGRGRPRGRPRGRGRGRGRGHGRGGGSKPTQDQSKAPDQAGDGDVEMQEDNEEAVEEQPIVKAPGASPGSASPSSDQDDTSHNPADKPQSPATRVNIACPFMTLVARVENIERHMTVQDEAFTRQHIGIAEDVMQRITGSQIFMDDGTIRRQRRGEGQDASMGETGAGPGPSIQDVSERERTDDVQSSIVEGPQTPNELKEDSPETGEDRQTGEEGEVESRRQQQITYHSRSEVSTVHSEGHKILEDEEGE